MSDQRRPPRGRRPRGPKGYEDEAVLSDEEVQRRIEVRGGGQLQPPPPEHKFRDRQPTPPRARQERQVARDSLLLVGLVIIGLVAVTFLLPDGPLTARSTPAPTQPTGSEAALASGPSSTPTVAGTPVLITLPPGPSDEATLGPTPTEVTPTATAGSGGATPKPTPTAKATPTTKPTAKPTAAPTATPALATIIVDTIVVNDDGGARTPGSWTYTVTSAGTATPSSFKGSPDSITVKVSADVSYSITASGPGGYTIDISSGCASATGGLPAVGTTRTCTYVFDDIKPHLTVYTVVVNGGPQQPLDWQVEVMGTSVSNTSFPGSADGVELTLDANSAFSVSMSNPNDTSDYSQDTSGTCSGTLGAGADVSCTFTFTYVAPAPPASAALLPTMVLLAGLGLGGRRRWTATRRG